MHECEPAACVWLADKEEDLRRLRAYNERLLSHISELEEALITEMELMREVQGWMPAEDRRTLIQNYRRPNE